MEIDVEQVVLNPVWIAESEWHLHDLASLYGRWLQATFDVADDFPETQALSAHSRLVVDVNHRAVG
ncbi:hypothetical protein D3C80_2048730 [compost metagenome]